MKKYKLSKKIMIGLLSGCFALTPVFAVNAETNSENESEADAFYMEQTEDIEVESMSAVETQVRNFVERLYTYILNRPADASGLQSWTEVLISGREQGVKVAQGFIQSPEFLKRNLSDTEYIKILYKTFLNREADAAGLKAWQNVLNDGLSRMHVFKGFAESDEFTRICQSYGIIRGNASLTAPRDQNEGVTKFVVRCYRKCLGREADENGLNNWCTEIISGKCTAKEAAYGFFFSDEFQKKNLTNTEYVKTLYQVMMNREADTSGLNAWVKVLEKGKSRAAVFNDFGNSDEFQKICSQYGITSGKGIFEVGKSMEEQMQLLVNTKSIWQKEMFTNESYSAPNSQGIFCWISDYDQNGLYEINMSCRQGSLFITSWLCYEVNSTMDGVTEITKNWDTYGDPDDFASLTGDNTLTKYTGYYDPRSGRQYYVMNDYTHFSASDNVNNYYSVAKVGNSFIRNNLGSSETTMSTTTYEPKTTYKVGNTFYNSENSFMSGMRNSISGMKINTFTISKFKGENVTNWYKALMDSANQFKITG